MRYGKIHWLCVALFLVGEAQADLSVARRMNEECLQAIRRDFPAPTVHSRNLYHSSAAMYDAWAAYDPVAVGVFHNESAVAGDVEAARNEAVAYAGYQVLKARYSIAVGSEETLFELDDLMWILGYPPDDDGVLGGLPAAVGNRCAAAVLAAGSNDGANEANLYVGNTGYSPVNSPLILLNQGVGTLAFPNRWQPLAFDVAQTQNGQVASKIQVFVGSHWGHVTPFALGGSWSDGVYANADPGIPPYLAGTGDAAFKANNVEVISYSAGLDPAVAGTIDISPGAKGNSDLGTNNGTGHALNPATGQPYAQNLVNAADFGRVLAEFWADGPSSETPPGHWNVLANDVADTPGFEKRLGGVGPVLDDLEWDVKTYLALNGAVHDAAVAAWGVKAHYDYVRPITSIRYMGGLGQSTNPGGPSYHPNGLPLVPGLIEVVTSQTAVTGQQHQGLPVGEIALRAWRGEPANPATQTGGVGWIRAKVWKPYQRSTFVTPAFAGYISGHSTFSRAAAEVLAGLTGSEFFPGGIATYTENPGELEFEYGPSATVQLQWATYYDAADEAGISRLYGGIHVAADDGPGRIVGSKVGKAALAKALAYMDGGVLGNFQCGVEVGTGGREIRWACLPGFRYKVQGSTTLEDADFGDLTTLQEYPGAEGSFTDTSAVGTRRFYRVVRVAP
jgi:hypothetical protein